MALPGPNPAARLAELSSEVGAALEFMAQHFGPPPLKTLAVSPIPGVFGQGFSGLVYLSTLAYLNPSDRPPGWQSESSRTFFSELLHAHETAHQWWGNLVTAESYQDEWVMEALANYSALMVLEKRKGRRALNAVLDEYRNNLLPVESFGPIIWGTRLISSQTPGAWRVITYEKGSWILHMLRGRLGDEPFLKMLGELAKRKRFQPLSTEEFRVIAAEFVPKGADDPKLEIFFDQWVYGTGVPALNLQYSVHGKAPKVRVRGKVIQTEAGEEFTAYVPVEVQLPGKRSVRQWVRTSSDPVEFEIPLKAAPVKVLLDPGNTVLKRK
jgi:aminopeptidase N